MRIPNSYFRMIMVVITIIFAFPTWAFDTLELETRPGIEYTYNGIKYLLNNGTARVCGSVKETEYITIPNSVQYKGKTYRVTEIDVCAFQMWDAVNRVPTNPKLKKIVLPNTIIKIGNYAFSGERKLEEINIPNSVKEIGLGAFYGCENLKSINIPEGVKEIKKYTFQFCYGLTKMDFPSTINEIGDDAFANCSSLEEVNMPNRGVKIYDTAFYGCKGIDINKIDCIIVPAVPKRIFVVFNKDGVRRETESTAIWMLFKTKEEAEKCYIGEYEYGKRDETFIKRDKLIYW